MNEVKMNDMKEVRSPEISGFKEIKPEKGMKLNEAKKTVKEKFDDNGELYRTDDKLEPNKEYSLNGYEYKTDSQGRIISAEGKLQLKNHDGRKNINDSIETIGKGYQKDTDDRGHLIADQFEWKADLGNLVPMDAKLNQGDFNKMENTLAGAVKEGADVNLKVEPVYSDKGNRPSEFNVTYIIDGEKTVTVFKNGEDKEL